MEYKDVWLSRPMARQIAELTGNHIRTVERWVEKRRIPKAAYVLLDLISHGRLELIHEDWAGWSICHRNGELRTPTGQKIHPQTIMSIPYRLAQIKALHSDEGKQSEERVDWARIRNSRSKLKSLETITQNNGRPKQTSQKSSRGR